MLKSKKNDSISIAQRELDEELQRYRINKVKELLKKKSKLKEELRLVDIEIMFVNAGDKDREFYIDA